MDMQYIYIYNPATTITHASTSTGCRSTRYHTAAPLSVVPSSSIQRPRETPPRSRQDTHLHAGHVFAAGFLVHGLCDEGVRGETDGWTDGRADGRTRTDGQTDGTTVCRHAPGTAGA